MLYALLIIAVGAVVAYLGHRYTPHPINVILLIIGIIIILFGVYDLIRALSVHDEYDEVDDVGQAQLVMVEHTWR